MKLLVIDCAEKMEAALILGQFDLKKEEPHERPFDSYFTNWIERT